MQDAFNLRALAQPASQSQCRLFNRFEPYRQGLQPRSARLQSSGEAAHPTNCCVAPSCRQAACSRTVIDPSNKSLCRQHTL